MSTGVEFEEDAFSRSPSSIRPSSGAPSYQFTQSGNVGGEEPGMIGWLIKHGITKSPQASQIVLVGIIVMNAIIAIVIFKFLL
jgi:hypothetical protein